MLMPLIIPLLTLMLVSMWYEESTPELLKATLFYLFSVAQIKFIVLALVDISNFIELALP